MMKSTEEKLARKNVRPTAMRLLVCQFLEGHKTAISLADLENDFERSDRTTLYRTLKTFEENGIVHRIDDGSGIHKYALCEDECNCEIETDLHIHFHCHECGETVCLPKYKIPPISLPESYLPEEVNLVVKGVCDKCS